MLIWKDIKSQINTYHKDNSFCDALLAIPVFVFILTFVAN